MKNYYINCSNNIPIKVEFIFQTEFSKIIRSLMPDIPRFVIAIYKLSVSGNCLVECSYSQFAGSSLLPVHERRDVHTLHLPQINGRSLRLPERRGRGCDCVSAQWARSRMRAYIRARFLTGSNATKTDCVTRCGARNNSMPRRTGSNQLIG